MPNNDPFQIQIDTDAFSYCAPPPRRRTDYSSLVDRAIAEVVESSGDSRFRGLPSRGGSTMRGVQQLQAAKQEQQRVREQVVLAARKAANIVAGILSQEMHIDLPTGERYQVVRDNTGWAMIVAQNNHVLVSTEWGYEESCRFGRHVQDGLVEAFANRLHQAVGAEQQELARFAVDGNIDPPLPSGDEDIITALAIESTQDGQQCVNCGRQYPLQELQSLDKGSVAAMNKNADKNGGNKNCLQCGSKGSVVPISSLPGGMPITGRFENIGVVAVG